MHRRNLADALQEHFDADPELARVVARSAGDLADAGRYREDVGVALTPDRVVEELAEAPDDSNLIERWNWWIGALSLAYGGYDQFLVQPLADE